MTETNLKKFNKSVVALAMASCISLISGSAIAAGLGKLNVLSGLGQPLRAEVEIGASKEELSGMTVRLAPQDAFRQAGVDFASVLLDLRFAVERRSGGLSVVKVTSIRPINEPFMDFLLELNWASGRLVREYTFLLDPPDNLIKAAPQVAEARVIETVRGIAAKETEERPLASKPSATVATAKVAPVSKVVPALKKKAVAESAETHLVKPGETLRKIAGETLHEGVSLEQMLVGLFKSNPDAFIANDINRLKAGAILNVPDKAAVEAVPQQEAGRVYTAQATDWGRYRRKLAAGVARESAKGDAASQSSSGKITAKVEEKIAPAEQSRDQVKVARTDPSSKNSKGNVAAEEADRIAKEKALKEAQERVVLLEKNVGDLQKLLELKSQKLTELQQAPKKEDPKPVESAKPADPPKSPVPEPAKPAESPKPATPTPEKPVEPAVQKPVESAPPPPPPPAPKKPAPPPPPLPEPDLLDSLLEDPLPLAGAGGLLALLGGLWAVKRRRSTSASAQTTAAPAPSSLGPNSVFRMTGGQSIDTGNTPPQTGEFSQTGPGTIDTDEVDPVAEADVYMAYGRDTQAEEILLEALQKDPQRTAIHAKLLEIYANRGSTKQFETLASELYAQTGGIGPEWQKVAAMGARLEPGNPLYSAVAGVAQEVVAVVPEMPAPTEPVLAEPVASMSWSEPVMTLPVDESPEEDFEPRLASADEPFDTSDEGLDFDLGTATEMLAAKPEEPLAPVQEAGDALDFDLGAEFTAAESASEEPEPVLPVEDFPASLSDMEIEPDEIAGIEFSTEGTLVASPFAGSDPFTAETLVDVEIPADNELFVEDQPLAVDFDLDLPTPTESGMVDTDDLDAASTATIVDGGFLSAPKPEQVPVEASDSSQPASDDSLEFDVKLTDSVFLGEPELAADFDIGAIDLDLSSGEPPSFDSEPASSAKADAPVRDAHWEEVNTKLDLAKAYEEMGDLEGARELLQEVVAEGPDDLVEQARTLLPRVGG